MDARYSIIYHPLAEKEYLASVAWYEETRTDLGLDFINEVENKRNPVKKYKL